MNYNSDGWRKFRRIVPFHVRWVMAMPLLALYVIGAIGLGIGAGCREFWREVKDAILEFPSPWHRGR